METEETADCNDDNRYTTITKADHWWILFCNVFIKGWKKKYFFKSVPFAGQKNIHMGNVLNVAPAFVPTDTNNITEMREKGS